jgi:hypothetical protein
MPHVPPAPRPGKAPAHDAEAYTKPLHDQIRKTNGDPFLAYETRTAAGALKGYPAWKAWVAGKLRDTVDAHAKFIDRLADEQDAVKADVAEHEARLAVLEAAGRPFLSGSG